MAEKRKRPKVTSGVTHKVTTGCGNMYVTPNWDGDSLIEVFAWLGRAGGCAHCQLEAITRSISLGLKYGVPVEEYVEELKDIRCPNRGWEDGKQILSCPDAIAGVLEDACRNNSTSKVPKP